MSQKEIIFNECIRQTFEANVDILTKAFPYLSFSNDAKLEMNLLTSAELCSHKIENISELSKQNFNNNIINFLQLKFSESFYLLPRDYFVQRLSDLQEDFKQCSEKNDILPLYSYYGVFKSPLRQFDINTVKDFDVIDVMKFKLSLFHLQDFNSKLISYLYNLC
jgi:hypothetical protein